MESQDRAISRGDESCGKDLKAAFRSPSPNESGAPASSAPDVVHRFRNDRSILCLAVDDDLIYAGSQNGNLLVRVARAHEGSILGLFLSKDSSLLFSSSSDRFVNLFDPRTLILKASIYSTYDVGDIFCVSYSSKLNVAYLGAQNTSIQWHDLTDYRDAPLPSWEMHPSSREHKFFDSPGPGGIRTPRPSPNRQKSGKLRCPQLEIKKDYIREFAHFGYVHCMLLVKGSAMRSQHEEVLLTGAGDGVVNLWTLDSRDHGRLHLIGKLDDGRDEPEAILTIAQDDALLYIGRAGGELNVWHLDTKQLVRTLKPFDCDILSLSIGNDLVFITAENGEIQKFSLDFERKDSWRGHRGRALASTFVHFQDNRYFITGGSDDFTAVWDVKDCLSSEQTKGNEIGDSLFGSLQEFISYRTISVDPRYRTECHKGASYLRSLLTKFGASTEMLSTGTGLNPIVYGRFCANAAFRPARKRILFYGHYDVIAADDKQQKWITEPFSMTSLNGYLYGRGISDNKGPVVAAIYAAADLASGQSLTADVVFLIEGEEEHGSQGFQAAANKHKELIGQIDWILLANSYWIDDEVPCLTYGLRGVIHATVEIKSKHPDLHSGVDGSRLLDEPLKDLVILLAKLTGPNGAVQVPGFYDPISQMTPTERQHYNDVSRTILSRNPNLGSIEDLTKSFIERWRSPSLTIHGFKTSGSEKSTIIPHLAKADVSLRLVPRQEVPVVAKALHKFLTKGFASQRSKNVLNVCINHTAEPWLGDPQNRIYCILKEAIAEVWSNHNSTSPHRSSFSVAKSRTTTSTQSLHHRASSLPETADLPPTSSRLALVSSSPTIERLPSTVIEPSSNEFKRKPLLIREGGSIPAIRFLEKEFSAPAAHLPCGQASDNAHLDNERLRVLNLLNARKIFRKVFRDLPLR